MEPQASQDHLGSRGSRACGDFLETAAPEVTGGCQGLWVRQERRANVDPLAQWDPRGCRESPGTRARRALRGHQDPRAAEERRGSPAARGTLPRDLLAGESKERREKWGPEELREPKGSRALPARFFLETQAPRATLGAGVPSASLAELEPRVTRGLLERRATLGGPAPQDLSAPEEETAKSERKAMRAPRGTRVCRGKLASAACGGCRELGGLWVRRETREIPERTDGTAALDPLGPKGTVGSRAPPDPQDGWWTRGPEPERRESPATVDRKDLQDPRGTPAPPEPPGRGASLDFGGPRAHRGTQVLAAPQETRATGAPLAWTAATGWTGSREPPAPLGCTVLRAKLGTRGETGFRASEESRDLLAPPAPLEHWESRARTASQA